MAKFSGASKGLSLEFFPCHRLSTGIEFPANRAAGWTDVARRVCRARRHHVGCESDKRLRLSHCASDKEKFMGTRLLLGVLTALMLSQSGVTRADERTPFVRIAELEIDPAQLEKYKAAVREEIE